MTSTPDTFNYFETDEYEESRARLQERREAEQRRARERREKRAAREQEIKDALNFVGADTRVQKQKSRLSGGDEINSRPTGAERNAHAARKTRAERGGEVDRDEQDLNSGAARDVKPAGDGQHRQELPGAGDDSDTGGAVIVEEVAEVDDPALDVTPTGTGRRALPGAGDDSDAGITIDEVPDVVVDDEVETVTPDERAMFGGADEPTDDESVMLGDETDFESYRDQMRVNRTQHVLLLHLQSGLGWSFDDAFNYASGVKTINDAERELAWLSPQIGNVWPGLSYTSKNAAINDLLTDYEGREHEVTPEMIDEVLWAREELEQGLFEAAKLAILQESIDNAVELGDEIVLTDENGNVRTFVLNKERWLYEHTDDLSNPVKRVGRLTEAELNALYHGGGLNYAAEGFFYPEVSFREKAVDVESTDAQGNRVFGDLSDALAGTFLTTDQHQFNIMTGEDGKQYMWIGGQDLAPTPGGLMTRIFKSSDGVWVRLDDEWIIAVVSLQTIG